MKKLVALLGLIFLPAAAWAQFPGSQGPVMFSGNCAQSPQYGKTPVCYDSGVNRWYYWNATANPPSFTQIPAGSGTINTGTGLTGDGSSGTPAALSIPVTVAHGGTNATSAGATAAHNIGAAAEGANSDITSLTGLTTPLSVSQGGTQCSATSFATLPVTPPAGTTCTITDAAACTAGTAVTGSGSTPCTVTYLAGSWFPGGGVVSSAAGGLTGVGTGLTAAGQTVSLTTPVAVANGGTGATSSGATAANNIGAAALGVNADITSLTGLTTPLPVSEGGTGATSGSATAAGNVGALAKANNLSDVTSASTARTNLGLGSIATVNSPVPVANGGTNATAAGATAANNIGALAEASNLSDLASASTARTNLGLGAAALLGVGTGLTSTGGNITLTTPVAVGNGGMGCPQVNGMTFAQLPGAPSLGATCTIVDAATCPSGATVTSGGGSTACQVTWLGSNWYGGGASTASSGSGSVQAPLQTGNTTYYPGATTSVAAVSSEIHIHPYLNSNPSDPLQAALSACPQVGWVASTAKTVGSVITDSNGDTEMVQACAGSCTTKTGTHPTWPTSAIANVGTQTVDNSGANQVTWEMIALGGYAPSGACTVVGDEGDNYVIPNAVLFGAGAFPVYIIDHGSEFDCTETGGAGHACLVEGNVGKFVGQAQGSPGANIDISAAGTSNMDAPFESESGYLANLPANPISLQQTNFELRNVVVSPAAAGTQHKAGVWMAGIEGLGIIDNMYMAGGPSGSTGLLVDDTVQAWNNIQLRKIWIGMGADAIGLDVEAGTHGGSGMTITGAIVDPTSATPTWLKLAGGASANIKAVESDALYLEGSQAYTSPSEVVITDGQGITLHSLHCNSGSGITDCVKITGIETDIHVDGVNAGVATNAVNDTVYNRKDTSQGGFVYDPLVEGATALTANTNASGSTTVTIAPVMEKYTLTANSTLNLAKGAGGNDSFFANPGGPTNFGLEVCQNGTGGFTLAFGAGSGVSNVYWSGGTQPSYTTTANHGDFYACQYYGNTAPVYCRETMSDVPCE